jgi:MFS family permease
MDMTWLHRKRFYPWLVVAMLWVVALLNYMDRQVITTLRPSMQKDIVELESAENFGYLMAVFLWIYGFASPAAGFISDRLNRKWLIVSSLFVWSAVTFLMGMAESFETLVVLRSLMGFSEAIYIPAALSLIADFHSGKTRALAIGIHMTGIYCGQAMGGFGATIAQYLSWQKAFFLFGFIGIAYALLLILLLREHRTPKMVVVKDSIKGGNQIRRIQNVYRDLFLSPAFWIILFCFAVPSLPGWAIKNWLPTLFSERLNIPMEKAGPLSTITIAASSLVGVVLGGFISDRWNSSNARGRVFTSAIGLLLTIPALLFIGLGSGVWVVVLAALCFGFGFGLFDANNMPIVCQFIPDGSRSTAYGIMNMSGTFAGALITYFMGRWAAQDRLGESFAMLVVIVFVAILLQLIFLKPRRDLASTVSRDA